MRLEDVVDYYKLKKICENPYEVLRFRKVKDENKQLAVRFKDGYKIFIQGGTDQYHTFHRVYLRDEYRINEYKTERMKTVLDLGANVGFFSCRMATIAEKVICYEPIKSNFDKIIINRNGRTNIEIVNKAVTGKEGIIDMYRPKFDNCSCRYSVVFNIDSKSESEVEPVRSITLDELFEDHKIVSCDLIKMDIEGAEYETLYNASDHTLKKISRIVGEYHLLDKDRDDQNIHTLKKYLIKKGYSVETRPNRRKDYLGLFFCQKS